MIKYKKVYCEAFGYCEGDYIPSEISSSPSVDLHHIDGRVGDKDVPENLIALTREEHERAHFRRKPYLTREHLQKIHKKFMLCRLK